MPYLHPIYDKAENYLMDRAKIEILAFGSRRGGLEWIVDECILDKDVRRVAKKIADKLNIDFEDAYGTLMGNFREGQYTRMIVAKEDDIFTPLLMSKEYSVDELYKHFGDKEFKGLMNAFIKYKSKVKQNQYQ